jgi:hypothetical protein
MSLTDTMTASRGTKLPLSMLRVSRAAASMPPSPDAELIALGERLKPMIDRWRRQLGVPPTRMTVATRERLYELNDQLHHEASELIDEILICRAASLAGLAIQVQAAMIDAGDALMIDRDQRFRGFFESLCRFTGIVPAFLR